jgi:protoporphyrinogen oxidase
LSRAGRRVDVAVIGAGIAGLIAADALVRAGLDVVILEAESQPGGRIRTVSYGSLYAESGAMVITASETQTLSLIGEFAKDSLIELGQQGADFWVGHQAVHLSGLGGLIGQLADASPLDRFLLSPLAEPSGTPPPPGVSLSAAYRRFLEAMEQQTRLITFPYRPDSSPDWDGETFACFLDRFHPALRAFADLQLKVSAAALSDEISLFWGLVTFQWNSFDQFHWIRGGLSRLPEAIAARLAERLFLGARVSKLIPGKPALVQADCDAGHLEFSADAVVVAIPPSQVLRVVGSQLEEWKRQALAAVPFGSYIPVHLRCRSRFWSEDIPSGYMGCAGTVFADLVDATRHQPGVEGILIAFIAGPEAGRLIHASDEAIVAEVIRDLAPIFPESADQLIEARVYRWAEAIPYYPPHFASTLEDLRRPQGNLFFCGDYMQGAGVNDAVLSGQIAAREVLAHVRRRQNL